MAKKPQAPKPDESKPDIGIIYNAILKSTQGKARAIIAEHLGKHPTIAGGNCYEIADQLSDSAWRIKNAIGFLCCLEGFIVSSQLLAVEKIPNEPTWHGQKWLVLGAQ